MLALSGQAWALSCDRRELPAEVQRFLAKSAPEWTTLRVDQLRPDDQIIWKQIHSGECPGLAVGNFNGMGQSYALNLVETSQGKLFQQLVVLLPSARNDDRFVLLAPMEVATFSVITRMPPGRYENIEDGRYIVPKYDSVALTALESGTIQYYWDGTSFRNITTSE
jgi:hypothetical protein